MLQRLWLTADGSHEWIWIQSLVTVHLFLNHTLNTLKMLFSSSKTFIIKVVIHLNPWLTVSLLIFSYLWVFSGNGMSCRWAREQIQTVLFNKKEKPKNLTGIVKHLRKVCQNCHRKTGCKYISLVKYWDVLSSSFGRTNWSVLSL